MSSQLCPVLEHQLLEAALMKTLQMSVAFWNLFSFPFYGTQRGLGAVVLSSRHYFLAFFYFFLPILPAHWGKAALLCALSSSGLCTTPAVVLYFHQSELRAAPLAAVQVGCITGTASAPCPAAGKRDPECSGSHCEHPLVCSVCRIPMAVPLYEWKMCFKRFIPKKSNVLFCFYMYMYIYI